MKSCDSLPKVYGSLVSSITVSRPIAPGNSHESICNVFEKNIMYGDKVLPVVPKALAQPNARLRTLVGNSSAMYT